MDTTYYLEKAKGLKPLLNERTVRPLAETVPRGRQLWEGDEFTLDFGTHLVGYATFSFDIPGGDRTPGAPLELMIRFAEHPCEFDESPYKEGLSRSWFQWEVVHIDNPLEPFTLPRRYAFRYVKVKLTANNYYYVEFRDCTVRAVSSADFSAVRPLPEGTDPFVKKIDDVACKTLHDCMQDVFEDGPKRDRRLWLGDLYLQAKTNYYTFRNNALVLRCLYLFAGIPHPDGCLSSAVYHDPITRPQGWILHDYALFFIGTLADYYRATGDANVLNDLWPVAFRQTEITSAAVSPDTGLVPVNMYFVDWCAPLDKTCAAQAIYVTMLKEALNLAGICGTEEQREFLRGKIDAASKALLSMYDAGKGLFVTPQGQVSVHSQMWSVLANVLPLKENKKVLESALALLEAGDIVKTVTPYALHYFAEALILSGLRKDAEKLVLDYWGGMVKLGADCFYEVYVPGDPDASPYNSPRMNSYCHAWSCTPSYLIRKYGLLLG